MALSVNRQLSGPSPRAVRLRALVMIRWAAVAGQLFTVVIVHWGMGYQLPIAAALAVIGASALLNVLVSFRRAPTARLDDRDAAIFLGFDVIQLATLLYLTGGLHNPFAILLLAPVAVAATILSFASTLAICFLAIIAISFIALLRRPLPWVGAEPELPEIYVGAIWVGLVLTTFLIAIYAWRVAEEARRMSAALSATSAALAREQQMSALGALAASAAHELGTPLGTITLIARELQREVKPGTPIGDDIQLLAQESARCRDILTRLTVQPTQDTSDAYRLVPLPAIVETAAAPYKRAEIAVHFSAGAAQDGVPQTAPLQVRSAEILQGLGTLLQNAMQFARVDVTVHTGWTAKSAWVEIEDDGPGFPPDVLESVGEPYISTRDGDGNHMGLGIFIAKSLLERSGARLSFANGLSGGARIVVEWPEPRFKDAGPKSSQESSKEAAQ